MAWRGHRERRSDLRRRRPKRPLKQAIYLWIGIALIPIGIVIAPLPGPGGIPILATAALLIVSSSRRAASWVRLHRRRWDWMHEILIKGEGWLGGKMGTALRRTNGRPDYFPPKPPASRRERVLDVLLFPVHVGLIISRALVQRNRRRAQPLDSQPAPVLDSAKVSRPKCVTSAEPTESDSRPSAEKEPVR